MEKIYLPEQYVNYPCKIVNNGYIRVYTNNNLTNYVDIYINQDYMVKEGNTNYGYNGVCDTVNSYTSDFWYRTDIDRIFLCFCLFIFLFFVACKVIYLRLFRRFN